MLLVVPINEPLVLALARTLSWWHETATRGLPALTGAPWRAGVEQVLDHLRSRGGSVLVATVPPLECGITAEERAAELTLTARVRVHENASVGLCLAREHRDLEAGLVAAGIKIIRVGKETLLSTLAHLRSKPPAGNHGSTAEQKLLAVARYRLEIAAHQLGPRKEFDLLMQQLTAELESKGRAESSVLLPLTAAWAAVKGWAHGALDCLAASGHDQDRAFPAIESCQARLDDWFLRAASRELPVDPREGVATVCRLKQFLEHAQSSIGEL